MSKCEHEDFKQIDYEFLKFHSCNNNCMVHIAYVECVECGMLGEREVISCGCKITWGEEE